MRKLVLCGKLFDAVDGSVRENMAIIVEQDRSNIYKRQKALLKDKFKITTDNKLENVLKNI